MIQTFKDWSSAKVRCVDISEIMGFDYPKAGLVYPGETVIEVEPGGYSLCIGNMTRTFPEHALSAAERDLYAFYLSECTDFPDILDSAATADTVWRALTPIMRVVGLTDTAYARAYCGSDDEWRAADKSRRVEILEGYVSAAIERES